MRRTGKAIFVIVGIVVVLVMVTLVIVGMLDQPTAVAPATAPTSTPAELLAPIADVAPTVTRDRVLQALASPKADALGKSSDDRAGTFIASHNARLLQLKSISFDGNCTWFTSGNARPMTVTTDLTQDLTQISCGPNTCQVRGATATVERDSAMQVDALYVLTFRRFNPADFTKSSDETIVIADKTVSVIAVRSANESLFFDAASRILLRLETKVEEGPVVVNFSEHTAPVAGEEAWFPTLITVDLPPTLFGFDIKKNPPHVDLRIDPRSINVTSLTRQDRGL